MAGNRIRRKEHGYFRAEGWHGEVEECATVQCCHCMAHFAMRKGSGKTRGFCCKCGEITCGRPQCDPCVPKMQQIENLEQGRDRYFVPAQVSLAGMDVPRSHIAGGILLGGADASSE